MGEQLLSTVYPNAKELNFVNDYKFNDEVLSALIYHIQNGNSLRKRKGLNYSNKIEKVEFLYYNYKDSELNKGGKPFNHLRFQDPDELNKELRGKLDKLGWTIKHHKIGKSGYKIRVFKTK